MANQKQILKWRNDGLLFAWHFLRDGHTAEELETELYYREKTGITVNLPFCELERNQGIILLRDHISQGQDLIWCAALKQRGFGAKRILRNLGKVWSLRKTGIIEVYERVQDNNKRLEKILTSNRYLAEDDDFKAVAPSAMNRDYMKTREEAIRSGLEIAKKEGFAGLAKRVNTRQNYDYQRSGNEIEWSDVLCRALYNEQCITDWLLSIHFQEGYGSKRLNEIMDAFESLYGSTIKGLIGFGNYWLWLQPIIELPCDILKESEHWPPVRIDELEKKLEEEKPVEEIPQEEIKDQEPEEEIPQITEPEEYISYPCMKCADRNNCKLISYRDNCTCLALYKEVRKENVKANKERSAS